MSRDISLQHLPAVHSAADQQDRLQFEALLNMSTFTGRSSA